MRLGQLGCERVWHHRDRSHPHRLAVTIEVAVEPRWAPGLNLDLEPKLLEKANHRRIEWPKAEVAIGYIPLQEKSWNPVQRGYPPPPLCCRDRGSVGVEPVRVRGA